MCIRDRNKIVTSGINEIDSNLDEAFTADVKINSFYPINELKGVKICILFELGSTFNLIFAPLTEGA